MGLCYSLYLRLAMNPTAEPRSSRKWSFEDGDVVSSVNSRFALNICFKNRTNHLVEALWLDFSGEEVSYGLIKPGATRLVYTYLTHPWVFRKLEDREVLAVRGKQVAWPNQTTTFIDIEEAPLLPWNTSAHASTFRTFDPAFACDVRNLLLAYYAHRKPNGRSCDVAGCRASNGKSRRISTGGVLGMDTSSTKAGVFCCRFQLWHWRGLEDCNALQTAPVMHPPMRTIVAAAAQSSSSDVQLSPLLASSPTPSRAESVAQSQPEDGVLGNLPFDIILEIIKKIAPPLRYFKPLLKDDMDLMPRGVEPGKGPVAILASRILGPSPPPAPVADPQIWFAEANNGALAAAAQLFGDFAAAVAGVAPLQQQPEEQQADIPGDVGVDVGTPVNEILTYMEATVLANEALGHATQMSMEQERQAVALLAEIRAQHQHQQQDGAGGQGLLEEQDDLAAATDEQEGGSQYGDAGGDNDDIVHGADDIGAQVGAVEDADNDNVIVDTGDV